MGTVIFISALIVAIFILDIIVFVRSKKRKSLLSPIAIVILLLILLFTVFLEYRGSELTSGEWSQTLLMIGLVSLTAFYAISTEKLANANIKMAEEMREQRYNMARPVIEIQMYSATDVVKMREQMSTREELVSSGMGCDFMNIGLGPATDVQPYIQDEKGEAFV